MNVIDGASGKGARSGPYIGRPMPRFEDLRLVRGAGNYTDDVSVPAQTYAVFVRTPHAHARIVAIDTAAARSHQACSQCSPATTTPPTAISGWRTCPIRRMRMS